MCRERQAWPLAYAAAPARHASARCALGKRDATLSFMVLSAEHPDHLRAAFRLPGPLVRCIRLFGGVTGEPTHAI